jgi:ribose/xylose/arabinose/galactoside ABC-type transport system permease subunit
MTGPDPDHTPAEGSRYPGEGFRVEPEFRQSTGAPEYVPTTQAEYALPSLPAPETTTQRMVTPAELDDAFDDPDHGEPGRDRFGIHWSWEAILLVASAVVAFLIANQGKNAFSDANLRSLALSATVTGALALAAGIGLRAGAVNFAIGPIMVAAGLYFTDHARSGFVDALVVSLVLALTIGLVIGLVVVILQVPSWAVSFMAYLGLQVYLERLPTNPVLGKDYHALHYAYYWYGAFAVVAIVGAGFGAVRSIRRAIGRYRPVGDPAHRRGLGAAVVTTLALAVSGLLAGLAGVISSLSQQQFQTGTGLVYTLTGIAVALVGGTSAYGRRGGLFGTFFAASLYTLLTSYIFTVKNWSVDELAFLGGALLLGLLVTRLVETYGRPRRGDEGGDSTSSWLRRQQGSWADQLPARSADVDFDASDERWGQSTAR